MGAAGEGGVGIARRRLVFEERLLQRLGPGRIGVLPHHEGDRRDRVPTARARIPRSLFASKAVEITPPASNFPARTASMTL